MNKYINVDKLIAKIKARQSELVEHIKTDTLSEKAIDGSKTVELQWVLDIIDSLQQEMWKPNEEQMKALKLAYEDAFECPEGCVPHIPLKSLLADLQKFL